MDYRALVTGGPRFSAVGFGCGSIGGLFVRGDRRAQREAVDLAVAGGINYFDTAALYGDGESETNLGRVLAESGADVAVGTKITLEPADLADPARAVREKLEAGLKRLRREQVEVCSLHNVVRSGALRSSPRMLPPDAVRAAAEAMHMLRDAGLAGAIGFTALGETSAIEDVLDAGFQSMQCYVNVLNPSALRAGYPTGGGQDFGGIIDTAARAGIGTFAIRVLAGGALSGTIDRHSVASAEVSSGLGKSEYRSDVARAAALAARAHEFGCESAIELSLRFVLTQAPITSAIVGFSDTEQVRAALRWQERGPLPPEAMRQLTEDSGEPG